MNIIIYSPLFYPSIGGLETIVSILAHEFVDQGHEVKLVSQTPATDSKSFPFEVIRRPNARQLLKLTHWCDVFFQGCVSLKGIWPLFIIPKYLIITHQTWYRRSDNSLGWQDYLKYFVSRFATNISISNAVAEYIPARSIVIPNSYRDDVFYEIPEIPRDKELVFLGRLVSDKGVDLLLEALANLKSIGLTPKLTIIGGGAEESQLHQQAKDLDIINQIDFVGTKVEQELAQILNAHKIMVVPSRWQEPFGIVALEGIACGCVVIGSQGGGLKDAIGPCGVTFPNGDVIALTQTLANLLKEPDQLSQYRQETVSHLSRHQKAEVAKAYLQVFEEAIS
ncbi:glycosyltransferase family 4 protein [Moorena sp. SIO3I6]|uniref:glycosyltransferase family 4 protein n=1 Tax=Moorena sp. SIO3I6 TaxID=2607831 RepID=UPI0013F72E9E|nr:glycosyltransferase family 4 protein [Moorena sp. SIO3I6]NEP27841.1 glycosyltransferase family 4 protein [Moorena sp. SIO3I6]